MSDPKREDGFDRYRRRFLAGVASAGAGAGVAAAGAAASAATEGAWGGATLRDMLGSFFQDHYQRMTRATRSPRRSSASSAARIGSTAWTSAAPTRRRSPAWCSATR